MALFTDKDLDTFNDLMLCEESQAVAKAFRAKGRIAFSNDLLPCSGGRPDWHLQGDGIGLLKAINWRIVIAFPPCTDLAVSGARWFPAKRADGSQQRSIEFFMSIARHCEEKGIKFAIENPVGIMSTIFRKPDQIIHPWQYGHMETKATCLWLNGLPKLQPTNNVYDEMMQLDYKDRAKVHYASPGKDRAKIRSKTYSGIAAAMAEQWSHL